MDLDNAAVKFFEEQFQRQIRAHEFVLNPFETLALDYIEGEVLDLGCGLGNLSLAAARRGHAVCAVDASAAAIRRIREQAALEHLQVRAIEADLESWSPEASFHTVVCIGLLMFFARPRAVALLEQLQSAVRPGGRCVVNVMTEGSTYQAMFEPGHHCLFGLDELEKRFSGWRILVSRSDTFPAPGNTAKVFATVVASRA